MGRRSVVMTLQLEGWRIVTTHHRGRAGWCCWVAAVRMHMVPVWSDHAVFLRGHYHLPVRLCSCLCNTGHRGRE